MDIFTPEDLVTLCRAMRHIPASDRSKFGAVLNKLKFILDNNNVVEDEFINDFNRFYAEGKRRREVERVVRETVRHMNVPQDEVRMGANWYGDMNDD